MDRVFASGSDVIFHNLQGQPLKPRNRSQSEVAQAVRRNDVTFAIGAAGTGKTYQAVMLALAALKERHVKKIIVTRPVVEAGESLGFLPGDLHEKVDPYLRPIYDALDSMIGIEKRKAYVEKGIVEIAPLAYLRGRTLEKAFVILDEAQNCTYGQLKLFLTRLGIKSRCVITGDPSQCDLPHWAESALQTARQALSGVRGIAFVDMDPADVVRHRIVADIVHAYHDFEHKPAPVEEATEPTAESGS
jgi:phosphate starvation-inducible protein PhoH and related proteins